MNDDQVMTSYARAERTALSDLFTQVGPDAPTLCEGWDTRDLAAHLVIRERRPDASMGIVLSPLAGWTEKVQASAAERPYETLVEQVRTGPPVYSMFRIPGVDEAANLFEFFVHHEDVRRATPGWEPRVLDADLRDVLWARLGKSGRMLFGKSPVGVVLRRTDVDGEPQTATLTTGETSITVTGDVGELVMFAFARSEAHVKIEGDDDAVAAFESGKRGL